MTEPNPTPAVLRDLIERVDLYGHVLRTLKVALPRVDPKTREMAARAVVVKCCLALAQEAEHVG